ncbi:uncharacterized protein [Venturia canescens]|uniref:uncharacterized protein n=1 Tax=Venturia canescens TaxID=32260 RepID=UPI001C9C5112|nr:uncharacterized protein LOC122405949 [Venturia canescens]
MLLTTFDRVRERSRHWERSIGAGANGTLLCRVVKCSILMFLLLGHSSSHILDESSPNDFVERCRRDCIVKKNVIVCGKYRVVRWLNEVVRQKEISYGPFRVIRIPSTNTVPILPEFPKPRDLKFGVGETLKFVRDIAEDVVTRRALVYTYDQPVGARALASGPMILDEDEMLDMQRGKPDDWRLFKKKKNLIFPILILLNLVKLKLLLLPILLGVHFIKKLIVIGGLFLPSILKHLKICKVPYQMPHNYPFHTWATAAETPVDYPTGYAQDEPPGWGHRNDLVAGLGYGGAGYHGYGPYSAYYGNHRQRR